MDKLYAFLAMHIIAPPTDVCPTESENVSIEDRINVLIGQDHTLTILLLQRWKLVSLFADLTWARYTKMIAIGNMTFNCVTSDM